MTYIPLQRGFLYLVAVMDWASRKVLSWRLSNTLDASFCVEAVQEALERYGPPEIFNSDQGSQFTSVAFTHVLTEAGIRISMDGQGRWMDNVVIERLWRSLKYECVYLSEFATGSQARTGIGWWMDFYDRRRPHSALNDRTPDEAYTDDGADRSPGATPRLPSARGSLNHAPGFHLSCDEHLSKGWGPPLIWPAISLVAGRSHRPIVQVLSKEWSPDPRTEPLLGLLLARFGSSGGSRNP